MTYHFMRFGVRLVLVAAILPASAVAQSWLTRTELSFAKATTTQEGAVVIRQSVVKKINRTARVVVTLGPLRSSVGINAYENTATDAYVTPTETTSIAGLVFSPRDIMRIAANGTVTSYIRGSAMGMPEGSRIDAIAFTQGGDLIFSVDTMTEIGSVVLRKADVGIWNGSVVGIYVSATEIGLGEDADIIALDAVDDSIFVVLNQSGTVQGMAYRPSEILEYYRNQGLWLVNRSRAELGVSCESCELTSIAVETSPTSIFANSFEQMED